MTPDTLGRLRGLRASLPPAEQRLADLALSDPRRVAALTITQLAAEADTSETSVLRFTRRLGLSGYPALRLSLAESAGAGGRGGVRHLAEVAGTDDLDAIIEKVLHADAAAVEDTARGLDRGALADAARAINAASRIDLFGVAASGLVVADLQQKLHRLGRPAQESSDVHLALVSASLLGSGDVALAVSHSGTTVEAVEVLHAARERGAATVVITNIPRSPAASAADHVLQTTASESPVRSGAMASRIAALVVVDILFLAVAQGSAPDDISSLLARSRRAVARHHRAR